MTLKLRFSDFRTITRARSLSSVVERDAFFAIGHALLDAHLPLPLGVRLLGLTLSGMVDGEPEAVQATLPL